MEKEPVVIPEKIYFKIGEVCEIVGVQAHVLRYWETEFPMLSPQKNSSGQRSYRRRDVEIALKIKQLLYNEMFTIAGARKKLQSDARNARSKAAVGERANGDEPAAKAPDKEAPKEPSRSSAHMTRERGISPTSADDPKYTAPTLFEGVYDVQQEARVAKRSAERVTETVATDDIEKRKDEVLRTVASHLLELREMLRSAKPVQ